MTGQLVAFGDDPAHQLRMPLGDPAKRKKCGAHAGLGENIEKTVRVPRDPAGKDVPIAAINDPGERLDLKIILDVHGEGVLAMHCGVQRHGLQKRLRYGCSAANVGDRDQRPLAPRFSAIGASPVLSDLIGLACRKIAGNDLDDAPDRPIMPGGAPLEAVEPLEQSRYRQPARDLGTSRTVPVGERVRGRDG